MIQVDGQQAIAFSKLAEKLSTEWIGGRGVEPASGGEVAAGKSEQIDGVVDVFEDIADENDLETLAEICLRSGIDAADIESFGPQFLDQRFENIDSQTVSGRRCDAAMTPSWLIEISGAVRNDANIQHSFAADQLFNE
ncbi:MAG TPA: hypothetical protein PK981_01945 [Accumulibacter sp.]|nr:hypothetical protein [Accumulibacter sp.]HMY06136.1 hypothetical protein [Accumulibacter sp.]HNG37791.1 hypothetical protein [Accumulibacter sp.]HNH24873.1 hypothetical protein [Accumulibacter sp.]